MRGEKCTLQWSMNLVPIVYPPKLPYKPSLLPTQETIHNLPRKRFFPYEFSTFQQHDIFKI